MINAVQVKRLYIANDTSDYHGGSAAVMKTIISTATSAGWQCEIEIEKSVIEVDRIESCDAVLVNGEGTMHGNKRRASHLMQVLGFAQGLNKQTALCNTSWFDMGNDHDATLRRLDQLCVREIHSARELEIKHGLRPDIHPDFSLLCDVKTNLEVPEVRFLTTDFYAPMFDCFVVLKGGPVAQLPFLDMRNLNWDETVSRVANAKVFLTGRFHGLMAACRASTRFVAFSGNTPKIDGTLAWFGDTRAMVNNPRDFISAMKSSHRNLAYYNEFFDWIRSHKAWTLNF